MSFTMLWTQFFPPTGPLTEANLPRQDGKVFIVTGGSSGLGYELSRILYGSGGIVYMLTRSEEHANDAISRIKAYYHGTDNPTGALEFVQMDLLDLQSVKTAAEEFICRQGSAGRLDVLFNNAGTGARMNAPSTNQGHEYHFGINTIGPFFLTTLLLPILRRTAQTATAGSVRVVWPASCLVEMTSPKSGIRKDFLYGSERISDQNELYTTSRVATWYLASEFMRRTRKDDDSVVAHIAGNPGNYLTSIWRHTPSWLFFMLWPILRNPIHGAETYLWMALSGSVTLDDCFAGRYAMCDGRWHPGQREDLILALRSESEGGSGRARDVFDWCEAKVKDFQG